MDNSTMPTDDVSRRQRSFFDVCNQCKTDWCCCNKTTPPITNEREEIIKAYLRENELPFREVFVKADYVFPRVGKDGYCIFHDKTSRKCLIHSVKPETCVAGPITFDINFKNRKIEWFIKTEKLCQLARWVHEDRELFEKHLESAKREILKLIAELDSEALRAILAREEPETFKIGEDSICKSALDKLTG